MTERTAVVIPARYGSTRLPGKPLVSIGGTPLIIHIIENILTAGFPVWVATDDERIVQAVGNTPAKSIVIDGDFKSGTERVQATLKHIPEEFDIIVNFQVDEIGFSAASLTRLVSVLSESELGIATPICPISKKEELFDRNTVKVVRRRDGRALYFSRQAIPYMWESPDTWHQSNLFYRHLGIYAFKRNILNEIAELPESPLEKAERLEQLRWLENGYDILTVEVEPVMLPAIDTPSDVELANKLFTNASETSNSPKY
ncbi:MAG: 3-deoxy-manno-octulosonate cytidylyltransferase [Chlorobi bacterium]|nr:3-deoxy-manno-octulosonate cytidylyltransferase [Chlorobiota bacterium]